MWNGKLTPPSVGAYRYFHTCPHLEPHDQCNFWLLATDLDAAGYPRDQIPKDTKHSVNLPFFWPSELAEDQASSAMGWGVSGPAAVAKGQTRLSFGTQPRVAKEEDDDVIVVTQSARESSKRRRRTDPEEASEAGENEATVQALKKKVKELEHKVKTLQTKLANLGQASLGSNLDSE